MARQRIFYLDNLCGLLIINMIFMVHLAGFSGVGDSTLMYYVKMSLGFFMSWFFFKAGMFFKEQPIKTIVRSSSKRLLVPYVVFNILGIVCSWIITFCHSAGGRYRLDRLFYLCSNYYMMRQPSPIWHYGSFCHCSWSRSSLHCFIEQNQCMDPVYFVLHFGMGHELLSICRSAFTKADSFRQLSFPLASAFLFRQLLLWTCYV